MTPEESQLTEAQRILDGSKCSGCGEYGSAAIEYQPGVLWIECARCRRAVSLPDFDTTAALKQWAGT